MRSRDCRPHDGLRLRRHTSCTSAVVQLCGAQGTGRERNEAMDHLPTIAHAVVHDADEHADVPFEDEATLMQDQALTHDDITEMQTDAHAAARASSEQEQEPLHESAPP